MNTKLKISKDNAEFCNFIIGRNGQDGDIELVPNIKRIRRRFPIPNDNEKDVEENHIYKVLSYAMMIGKS